VNLIKRKRLHTTTQHQTHQRIKRERVSANVHNAAGKVTVALTSETNTVMIPNRQKVSLTMGTSLKPRTPTVVMVVNAPCTTET
jgi:hypothetical protein